MRLLCMLSCIITANVAAEQLRSPGVFPRRPAYYNTTTAPSSITRPATTETTTTSLLYSTWTIVLPTDRSTSTTNTLATSTTDLPFNSTTSSQCIAGSVATYLDAVYPTSYITIEATETYTITVTDENSLQGVYEPTVVFETPLAACTSTVIPIINPTSTVGGAGGAGGLPSFPAPPPLTLTVPLGMETTVVVTVTPSPPSFSSHKFQFTSTVVVTKKTSVPEVYRPSDNVPTYRPFSSPTNKPQGANNLPAFPGPTAPPSADHGPGSNAGPDNGIHDGSNDEPPAAAPNSKPNGQSKPTPFLVLPTNVVVDGVPVTVRPSVVVIDGTTVVLPTASPFQSRTVVVGGKTLTVYSQQIVGPHTTLTLDVAPSTITQAVSTVTKNGLVVTIGPTLVAISGTTYRIGPNVPPVTLTLGSQTVTLNNNGLVLPSDTLIPPMTLVIPQPQPDKPIYKLVVVDGVTMSIDASEAIVSGTTFRIGNGAPSSITVVDGHTITLSDVGVIIDSQTVTPTSIRPDETLVPSSGQMTSIEFVEATGSPESHSRKNGAPNENQFHGNLVLAVLIAFCAFFV